MTELIEAAAGARLRARWTSRRGETFCSPNCRPAASLLSPFVTYSEETNGELEIVRAAADTHRRYGKRRDAELRDLAYGKTVSDILEVAVLLKEVGLLRPRGAKLDVNIVPLFETIEDLAELRTR